MRNLFDQYEQPENRLSHALASTLSREPSLLKPFLTWTGAGRPGNTKLRVVEQQLPGIRVSGEAESNGLPDVCFYSDDGYAVLLEAKIQAGINPNQLKRHIETAKKRGFEAPRLILVSVDEPNGGLPIGTRAIQWRNLYSWFRQHANRSKWAQTFVEYMEVFEARMIAREYAIRGTITMFDGFHFDDDHPYTYLEGKRLIRLLGDELRKRRDLEQIGLDANAPGRSKITGRDQDFVWDFIPLRVSRKTDQFTSHPHFTMGIGRSVATAALTVPNGVKGAFRRRLNELELSGFTDLMAQMEKRLRPVLKRSPKAKPMAYITQRHYNSQNSPPEVDARLDADLRTLVPLGCNGVKHQPQWLEAIYLLLANKRSNIQFGVDVKFDYSCPVVQSAAVVELFADTWKALFPLAGFVLGQE